MATEVRIDGDVLAELVSHIETLMSRHDTRYGQDSVSSYASARCKELLLQHPLNGDRFLVRRSWTGRYRIWDANKQGYWARPGSFTQWSTREREWANEKVCELNAKHRATYAAWRNEQKEKD